MKAAELNAEMVFQTTKSARPVRSAAALIVDVETAWSVSNRDTWARQPERLVPHEPRTSSRGQRYLPVVAWDGWAPDEDTRTAKLREAAELVRPLLVDGAEIGDLGRAVTGVERVVAETGANGGPRFVMLRAQDIECLRSDWLAYEERVRVSREQREAAAAAESARQAGARARMTPLFDDAGLKLDRLATYDGDSIRLSWTDLERIVLARPEQWSA